MVYRADGISEKGRGFQGVCKGEEPSCVLMKKLKLGMAGDCRQIQVIVLPSLPMGFLADRHDDHG